MITVVVIGETTMANRHILYLNVPKRSWLYYLSYKVADDRLFKQDNHLITTYANHNLNPGRDKILQLFDNRLYYLRIPAEFDNPTLHGYFTNPNSTSSAEINQRLRKNKFTYLIISRNWGVHPTSRVDLLEDFLQVYTTPVSTSSGVTIYQIK